MQTTLTNSERHGPLLIGFGLIMVLAAQMVPGFPLAAGIALIGLGATHTLSTCRQHELLLGLNLATYVGLVALAIAAELHTQITAPVIIDGLLATAILLRALTGVILPHRAP